MKSAFIQPRFIGPRFEEHTLPLDVASDLRAYEELIVELAKRLYLNDHPTRQRVPKRFDADFHLHLEQVEPGSSRPLLSIVAAGTLLLPGSNGDYFQQSKELVNECIAAEQGQLPEAFPRDLLKYFNRFGRSLRSDEKVEFSRSNGTATLTPERRKHLVLAVDKEYEREIDINGFVEEADWQKSSFRLRHLDGSKSTIPMSESFHDQIRKIGGNQRHLVSVSGIGAFDEWDRLRKVLTSDFIEIQTNYELNRRFEELKELKDGWFDGAGLAPNPDLLDEIAEKMISDYPKRLMLPAIVATPEGNLLLEWENEMDPSVDLILTERSASLHAFGPDGSDIEKVFPLTNKQEWDSFFNCLDTFASEGDSA